MADNYSKRHRKAFEAKRAKSLTKLTRNPTPVTTDWQISRHNIKSRTHYLFENGTLTDCSFLVGREPKEQKLVAAHKLILAMASPVFYTMFYGSLPETKMIIPVTDLDHSAFSALLEYIYTDAVVMESVDEVFELYRAAKKYMLQYVVDKCLHFLMGNANPTNVFRVYEFATFFDELQLKERCLRIIRSQTMEVIKDDGLENVELETLMMLMEQDELTISSETELFTAINRYAVKNAASLDPQPNQDQVKNEASPTAPLQEQLVGEGSSESSDKLLKEPVADETKEPQTDSAQSEDVEQKFASAPISIRDLIKRVRFLSMTPKQFVDGPIKTTLLTQPEMFAILANISSPDSGIPMPEGFSTSRALRGSKRSLYHFQQ
ncbi:BTB/POZ domain-containing protein 2-like [Topomyia yanbarensis]|uniref:BTB/POZ domain-containing protein 2-like n=1 Tax=Topomyia yanbarensis TaxID=2498891 RepID=UPI00273C55DD|nr:BTB/POZ domain-containing protein 2-like [Topomyia yanbarensis]XP_058840245.1 BTB/POZ domain-containing protein 2-like [Topomyia yanbarensis]